MSHGGRTARRISRKAPVRSPALRIVVVTEGAVTEPSYLRTFDRLHGDQSSAKLVVIPDAGDPRAVVERAIEESRESKRDRLGSRDTVWAMFDRDEHSRFAQAKDMARGNGIRLAISNPCFELWGILHYQECDAPLDRHECQRKLGELCPGYSNKKGKIFDDPEVIESKYQDAVGRAENALTRRREEGDPEGNPSTTVHRLTGHILSLSGSARAERKK